MPKLVKPLVILACLWQCLVLTAFGQGPVETRIDSLKGLLAHAEMDTARVTLYYELAWEYLAVDSATAFKHAFGALNLADSLGSAEGKAKAYFLLGACHSIHFNFEQELVYMKKAVAVVEETGAVSPKVANLVYCFLGRAYFRRFSEYDSAEMYLKKSVAVLEGTNAWHKIAYSYRSLCHMALEMGNDNLSRSYLNQAVHYHKKINHPQLLVSDYLLYASGPFGRGDYATAMEAFLEALRHAKAAKENSVWTLTGIHAKIGHV